MPFSVELIRKLEKVGPELREVLLALLEEVERQREESVTKREFLEFARQTEENFQRVWQGIDELRKTVKELAEAQRRTEEAQKETKEQIRELAEAQKRTEQRLNELAEAQKETDQKVRELAEAQKKTEQKVQELAEAQRRTEEAQKKTEEEIRSLSIGLKRTREQIGGLARSVAYALENEAYVRLPDFLKKHYGIEITEKFIRTEIRDEEINLFARGKRDGRDVVIVGESVLKLDDITKVKAVLDKVDAMVDEVEGEVVPIIVTHFAKRKILDGARRRGIIVVQSFEW